MIFVRHTEECTSKPVAGRLTGKCNCKTAPLDQKARTQLQRLLDKLAEDSIDADEASEYFALRLDELAEQIAKEARSVRRNAKRSDRAARVAAQTKRASARQGLRAS